MLLYKFLSIAPYTRATSPKALPAIRRVICLSEEGLDKPNTPCVIINRSTNKVFLPNGEVWNLGGTSWADRNSDNKFSKFAGDARALKVYMIWRWPDDDTTTIFNNPL